MADSFGDVLASLRWFRSVKPWLYYGGTRVICLVCCREHYVRSRARAARWVRVHSRCGFESGVAG